MKFLALHTIQAPVTNPHEKRSVVRMASRFLRFFVLAVLLVTVPSFVYLSQRQNGFVRDPKTGEWFSQDSYAHGNRPAQVVQGHGPVVSNVIKGFSNLWNIAQNQETTSTTAARTSAPASTPASATPVEPEVAGVYAHKMTNATAK